MEVNLAFGFFLKKVEEGGFRYFYAHENNNLLDRSKLICTRDDLAKLENNLSKTDVIESCSRERMNTKWRSYKLTNLTVIAILPKDGPMGCKNAVLPKNLLRKCTINCLTCEENTTQPNNDNLCLFCVLGLDLHGTEWTEEETSKVIILFINKMEGLGASHFQGLLMKDIAIVGTLLTLSILLYGIDIVDGNTIRELARRSVQKHEKTVRLLRWNNHICYVNNIDAVFQSLRCPNCDTFFSRTFNLERHLTTCSERVKNIYPRNKYRIWETLSDKLNSFGIKYTSQQKLFKNSPIFDFESSCDHDGTLIGKQVPISLSISSNLVEEPTFLCNCDPHHLVASFIGALERLASNSKAQMILLFFDIETTIKIRLEGILEKLSHFHNRREQARFDMSQDDFANEICASTHFLHIPKNKLFDLQDYLERYCNVLPLFGFNSAKLISNPMCYPFLLTNKTLNLLTSWEQTSSSRSRLMIFSYWIYWIF